MYKKKINRTLSNKNTASILFKKMEKPTSFFMIRFITEIKTETDTVNGYGATRF